MKMELQSVEKLNSHLDLSSLPLPEGCIAHVISLTTPSDACRLALVSRTFCSAAESDFVWDRFLPSSYQDLIPSPLNFSSKKKLFFYLCKNPIFIDDGKKMISLDKWSGKRKYMLSAADFSVSIIFTTYYVEAVPESRFEKAVRFNDFKNFVMIGKMSTSMLFPNTNYSVNLVYKINPDAFYTFGNMDLENVSVGVVGGQCRKTRMAWVSEEYWGRFYMKSRTRKLLLKLPKERRPRKRIDGWFEVGLGEYFKGKDEDDEEQLEIIIRVDRRDYKYKKNGLIIEGVDIKPKISKVQKHKKGNAIETSISGIQDSLS